MQNCRLSLLIFTVSLCASLGFGIQTLADGNVYLGPITKFAEYQLSGRPCDIRGDGDVFVWQVEVASLVTAIEGFDFSTHQPLFIRSRSSFQPATPDISGRNVVWSEVADGA